MDGKRVDDDSKSVELEPRGEEKKESRFGKAVKMGAKVYSVGQQAYEQGAAMAQGAALAGANAVAEQVEKRLTEEQRQHIVETTNKAKQVVHAKIGDLGDKVKEGIEEGKVVVKKAQEDAYAALSDEQREFIQTQKQKLKQRVQQVKAVALNFSGPMLDKAIEIAGAKAIKSATADPDMPDFIKRQIKRTIEDILPDLQLELGNSVHKLVLQQKQRTPREPDPCCYPTRWRGWFLYNYLPYDKTIFACLKNPAWWLPTLITLIPVFGVRFFFFAILLFLLVVPCPPDEFQLIQFIQKFKGMQYLTGGVVAGLVGAYQYFACLNFEPKDHHTCFVNGPGASESFVLGCVEFIGSMFLVWCAFFMLPYSEKKGGAQFEVETDRQKQEMQDAQASPTCCGVRANKARGGRLTRLLKYDFICFVLCMGVLVLFTVGTAESSDWDGYTVTEMLQDARFRANIYWVRVIYSLLAFPFFLFSLPVLKRILTHAEPTGFAPSGECIAHKVVFPDPEEKALAEKELANPSQKLNQEGQVVIEVTTEVEQLEDTEDDGQLHDVNL